MLQEFCMNLVKKIRHCMHYTNRKMSTSSEKINNQGDMYMNYSKFKSSFCDQSFMALWYPQKIIHGTMLEIMLGLTLFADKLIFPQNYLRRGTVQMLHTCLVPSYLKVSDPYSSIFAMTDLKRRQNPHSLPSIVPPKL